MTLRIYIASNHRRTRAWFDSLSNGQRMEIGNLDKEYRESEDKGVHDLLWHMGQDWVEEHGGERNWWFNIHSYEDIP